jgi:hypothetical protein
MREIQIFFYQSHANVGEFAVPENSGTVTKLPHGKGSD